MMRQPRRKCASIAVTACAALLLVGLGVETVRAQEVAASDVVLGPQFRRVKLFDFDESKLGNYEPVPMHWRQKTGPGLPAFASGEFDTQTGHDAPPAFRLSTRMKNVGYEYEYPDLDVLPGADYLVVGYIRTKNVRHSRALISAFYVDRYGDEVPDSRVVSSLVCSTGDAEESWERVELLLPGTHTMARSLRLQCWIIQGYEWREPSPTAVDPIVAEDIDVSAWFDDIAVYRLPRAVLEFSNPAALTTPGRTEALILAVHNASDQVLNAEVEVRDARGLLTFQRVEPIPADCTTPVEVPLPPMPVGEYTAHMTLRDQENVLLQRRLNFAVLNELPHGESRGAEVGVALPAVRIRDAQGVWRLADELGIGAVHVSVPMSGAIDTNEKAAYFSELSDLVHELVKRRIAVAGILLAPDAIDPRAVATATRRLIEKTASWRERLGPVLAQHNIGGMISNWQMGYERNETLGGAWAPEAIEDVREYLSRFVALPRVIIPSSVLQTTEHDAFAATYWVPATVATRDMAEHLSMFGLKCENLRWLSIEPRDPTDLDYDARLTDLARRFAIAKALDPDRVVIPAPFEQNSHPGAPTWQPTEGFVILRNLIHHLTSQRGVGAIRLDNDGVALIFDGPSGSCVVLWTWRDTPQNTPVELYLGDAPGLYTLWGEEQSVGVEKNGRTRIHLTPMPMVLTNVDAPLALLQASFEITPQYVQIHDPTPKPVLTFRNHYDQRLIGSISFPRIPKNWQIDPEPIEFDLGPGEAFSRPLDVIVPKRQVASRQMLGIHLDLDRPKPGELDFDVPITVGLRDVLVYVDIYWRERTLVIEQHLRNLSKSPVSFRAFCQPPLRPYREDAFMDVAPGQLKSLVYEYDFDETEARQVAGLNASLGIREINGDRELDQVVEIPR